MAQSTDVIPEKHTLRWDIFSSLKNTAPNQIIRFHPGILQLVILCNQSSGVSEKKESSAQKKTQVTTKDVFLFFGVLGNQVFFLHRRYTFWWLLFLPHFEKINVILTEKTDHAPKMSANTSLTIT